MNWKQIYLLTSPAEHEEILLLLLRHLARRRLHTPIALGLIHASAMFGLLALFPGPPAAPPIAVPILWVAALSLAILTMSVARTARAFLFTGQAEKGDLHGWNGD
jgi:hypothetical protein